MRTLLAAPSVAAFLCLTLAGARVLEAQATGRLTGTVTDASGAKAGNAKVSLSLPGGANAILSASTTSAGAFDFPSIRAGLYDVTVELPGFNKYIQREVKVDPARETALPEIKLEVAAISQTVEVAASIAAVQTTTFEVANTVTQKQVMELPVGDRQITNLFSTQAGVGSAGFAATTINGLRPTYSAVTLDGISVQDNWVRTNTLDFMPNRLTISQVAEMTVSTSNSNTSIGGGANQISMVTPSGTNQFHGSGYWFNRNVQFAANDWFNNQNDIAKPALNLNQLGGSLGGPVKRDKLLFYVNYESYRRRSQTPVLNRVLTPSARQGLVTWRDASGATRQFNVLQASGLSMDPTIQQLLGQLPANGNSSQLGDGLNTAGYSFNARSNITRDSVTAKADYYLTQSHTFTGSYLWNRDYVDRPGSGNFFTTTPPVSNQNTAALLATSWRWIAKPTLTNELRGGYNRTGGPFNVSNPVPDFVLTGLSFTSPINARLPEGRDTGTYVIQDNANWLRGKHAISFGYQSQFVRTPVFDYINTVASYGIGIGPASPYGFNAGDNGLPGNMVSTANTLLASLAGLISTGTRSFNITNPTSGFVPGEPQRQNFSQDNHSLYISDSWKIRQRLNLIMGVRWDYWTVVNERNSLVLQPILQNNDAFGTLLSNASMDLHGNSVGRPYYKKDLNNLAPNFGFAWDPFGDSKTSIRGGYSIAYTTDNTGNSIINTTGNNTGLIGQAGFQNATATLRALPPIPTPRFQLPVTAAQNFTATGRNSTISMVDPRLATPYVQQWSFGIQRAVKGFLVEGRYVGNHAVKSLRQLDANQINPFQAGFNDDFLRARNNGFLALAAGRGFDPAYNGAIAGSQPLTLIPGFGGGGSLANATVRGLIQRGEVATLAQTYFTSGASGAISFFPNPNSLFAGFLTNVSNSSYNSAQVEVRRSWRNGNQFQANYVFGKVLTDASALRGLDPVLDNRNARLERSRAIHDITQAFKINHVTPIPIGKGHRLSNKYMNPVIGGWIFSGFLTLQTGMPLSVFSARGTFNRGSRSGNNTADTTLTREQLRGDVVGFFMTGDGPYFINPKNIGPDGRGVAADGARPFDGQAFSNPQPGTVGSFNRRSFNGPALRNYDFGLLKNFALFEGHSLQVRAEFFNLTNTPSFLLGGLQAELDAVQNVNNPAFGRVISTATANRQVQFSLYYRF